MSMLRRTIQLTHCKDMGQLTIVRIGSTVGVKLTLAEAPEEFPVYLSLKIGNRREIVFEVNSAEEEFAPETEIYSDDYIGAIVLTKDMCVFCAGGRRELVNIKTTKKEIDALRNKTIISKPNLDIEEPKVEVVENAEEVLPPVETAEEQAKTNASFFGEKGPFIPKSGENFFKNAKERFQELFTIYPREEELCRIIPESEWVKVTYDGDDYYLVGLLKDEGKVTHIGYGIPGEANIKPPKEVVNMCDFLPMPNSNEKGWWLMFQNPADGTMIVN